MRVRVLLIAVSVAVLGFAPAPLPRQQRQHERADVAGTWQIVLWENSGNRYQGNEEAFEVSMTRSRFTLVVTRDGTRSSDFVMRLDPSASPPAFTWSQEGRVRFVGSYRLRGDEMTMILSGGERLETRPTDFEQKQVTLRFVLKRIGRE